MTQPLPAPPRSRLPATSLALTTVLVAWGCGGIAVLDGGGATGGGGGLGGGGLGGGGLGGGGLGGGGLGGGGLGGAPPVVYANNGTTLFRLDAAAQEIVAVGALDGCSGLNELAVDQQGKVFGTSDGALYALDPDAASCEVLATGTYPRALSFVPAGTLDPDEEALVGYLDAAYLRVDTVTGAVTELGQLGGGFVASGDLVSVLGGKTYVTVTQAGCNDCLVEVDPVTGEVVELLGPLGLSKVWGLAYWGGAAYGFTKGGDAFRIDFVEQPAGPPALALTDLATAGDFSFWGAGSSTAAPIE